MVLAAGSHKIVAAMLVALLALVSPPTAIAQGRALDSRSERIAAAFKAWAARNNVASAVLSVSENGRHVVSAVVGTGKLDKPELLASLSKAVTAVCVATLIQDGKLAWTTTLRDALKKHFAQHGTPTDARILSITVEQLVTHRGGFSTRPNDALTTATLREFLKSHTARETHFNALLAATLRHPLAFAPGERHAYSNAGYLALGAIIEETTGKAYEAACRERVLVPLGAGGARLDRDWTIMSSFGGWSMTAADYQRFYAVFAPDHTLLKPSIRAWMAEKEGKLLGRNPAVWYSLGVRQELHKDGSTTLWHSGSWGWRQKDAADGPLASTAGSIAQRWSTGMTAIATFNPIPRNLQQRNAMYEDLRRSLLDAATTP